jgi:dUTP pyrophosphatase
MEREIEIPILVENGAANEALLPIYATDSAAGADVRANIKEPIVIASGKSALLPTGLRFEIPEGYEIQIRPRSGLALKNQVTVLNTPGTIDADYRGEVGVILINHSAVDFVVTPQLRIAQIIVAPVVRARFVQVENVAATTRGSGGFGSTGAH